MPVFSYHALAQTGMTQEEKNMVKYWYYRNRLQYFMVEGSGVGESQVAGVRNHYNSGILSFGQHSAYLGDYMGVLATEYYLLDQNDQDVNQTLLELYYAMQTYIEQMDKCESEFPWESLNMNDQYDGFFMRNNVPNDFVDLHPELNKNIEENSSHSEGNPGWINCVSGNIDPTDEESTLIEVMSQDEAIFLLRNLALVKKYVPDNVHFYDKDNNLIPYDFKTTAKTIATSIIDFIRFSPYQIANPWEIWRPDGVRVRDSLGGNAKYLSYGFRNTYSFLTESIYGQPDLLDVLFYERIFLKIPYVSWIGSNVTTSHLSSSLAAVGNCWHTRINLGLIHFYISSTQMKLNTVTDRFNWDTFYISLWAVLHDKEINSDYLSMQKIRDQLNAAPCNGPYMISDVDFSAGWACSAKFWHDVITQNEGATDFRGMYNGLDYMLLFNLYRILNPNILPAYNNYHHPYHTGNVTAPENYIAMRSIQSEQLITAEAQSVEFRAGENIELLPGFGTETGVDFTAYIEPVACDENIMLSESSKQYFTRTIIEDTLSLVTLKCSTGFGDTIQFNGIDDDTTGLLGYNWSFPEPAQVITSNMVYNPKVLFPLCNHTYDSCSLIITDTANNTGTLYFSLHKECCDTLELKNQNNLISAFPNPNRGVFNLISKDANVDYSIKVYNLYGQIVYSGSSQNGEAKIVIQGEPVGLYLINLLYNDGRKQTIKVEIN